MQQTAATGFAFRRGSEMLSRQHRLRRSGDFQTAYRRGRHWAHPLLALQVLPRPSGIRVGVTAGKKVGIAVVRNRVRRRLREIVRAEMPGWRRGCDVILSARAGAADATFAELGATVRELARRARLPREPNEAAEAQYQWPGAARGSSGERTARRSDGAREREPD